MGLPKEFLDAVSDDVRRLNPHAFGKISLEQPLQKMQQLKGGGQSVPPLSTPTKEVRGHPLLKNGLLVIPLAPVAKARARTVVQNGKVHSYTPEKTEGYEDCLRVNMMHYNSEFGQGMIPKPAPIRLTVTLYIQQPKRAKLDYPTIRPDVDNYVKSLTDAGNGILWEDDSQITELHARKVYTNKEGYIELLVEIV